MFKNKFLPHTLIAILSLFLRVVLTYILGDLIKYNETIVFFLIYLFVVFVSFKLNSIYTYKNVNASFMTFLIANIIFSIIEFFIFKALSAYIGFQFIRIFVISPSTLFLRYYLNKNFLFK